MKNKQKFYPYSFKVIRTTKDNNDYLVQIAKINRNAFTCKDNSIRNKVKEMIESDNTYFILLKNDVVLSACFKDEFEGEFGITNICSIEKRKGYGSLLIKYIQLFYKAIRLEVWDHDEEYSSGLLEFYKSLGFEIIKTYTKEENNMPEHSKNSDIGRIFLLEWRRKD